MAMIAGKEINNGTCCDVCECLLIEDRANSVGRVCPECLLVTCRICSPIMYQSVVHRVCKICDRWRIAHAQGKITGKQLKKRMKRLAEGNQE